MLFTTFYFNLNSSRIIVPGVLLLAIAHLDYIVPHLHTRAFVGSGACILDDFIAWL